MEGARSEEEEEEKEVMLTSLCVCTYERTTHLNKVFNSILEHAWKPYEVIIVDDASKNLEVSKLIGVYAAEFEKRGVRCVVHRNAVNLKHAASQNRAWELAKGDILFHIEDDIVVPYAGWNQEFARFFQDHPEVGQVIPEGSGRGEWIPRGPYNEYAWGLGGLFAVRKEVYKQVGGWDESLCHQIEPDYNLSVRMGGWRVAEIPGIRMIHHGEGEEHDTFRRQAQIRIGVHSMLMKWNHRFHGVWDYDDLWSMSWDDFPPNAAFRRKLASWFAGEAQKLELRYRGLGELKDDPHYAGAVPEEIRKVHTALKTCELNKGPEPFQFPGHWGQFELVKTIRPRCREREQELITLMQNNFVFGGKDRLEQQLRDCAKSMDYDLSEKELKELMDTAPVDYKWDRTPIYREESK